MKKPKPAKRLTKPAPASAADSYAEHEWHNGGDIEINFYARSLRKAARALLSKFHPHDADPRKDWDACPVLLLYRQALELHLKMFVGEGSNFLERRIDPITLSQTHSLRWLAQIVAQIIKTVKWEDEFKCDGVRNLGDFSILVNDVEALDPVTRVIRTARTEGPDRVTQFYRSFDIVQLGKKLDALLDLLSATTDGLAATWGMKKDGVTEEELLDGLGGGETIH